ncbi:MAG: endonuclease [Bacteriovorax sp.]|jgi:hypothetical protein
MKKCISTCALVLSVLFPLLSFASNVYYPTRFQEQIAAHELQDEALKNELFIILSSQHTRLPQGNDLIGCDQHIGRCFSHAAVGYSPARKYLYNQLHAEDNGRGKFLRDVYCHREVSLPINENIINCEHTWPQSKFSKSFNNELQKSDMHHLFPTDKNANSTRGNYDFAEVVSNLNLKNCEASKSGASVVSGGKTFFEPPSEHKGNVARAMFYFSVRYKLALSNEHQTFLRKWSEQDPVDDAEMARNDEIEKLQGDRNPFIDFPNLAQDISKF